MKRLIIAVLLSGGMCAQASFAQPEEMDNEIQAAANFIRPLASDGGTFTADVAYGYFVTDALEVGIRQGYFLRFQDPDVRDTWAATTTPFLDYHFLAPDGENKFVPFIGGFIGGIWNDDDGTGLLGPEGGLKIYLNDQTSLFGRYRYEWLFDDDFDAGGFGDVVSGHENHVVTVGLSYAWGCGREMERDDS